ncbi:hypothetical protein IQ218_05565 [Synechocystis salina LEGE 06099]|uniref:hypothetical protein n=1 Tax=Synechocystis salina TaxID=945780 RepID=UPI00187E42BD|nr:hypothetical protein [Synechocystis salina]MBE9203021.1 hypothetical protein [Synechocystis salina LEGE 06099]
MTEQLLKMGLIPKLSPDFEILEEIWGYHPIYDVRLRIDVFLRAKPHLIAEGFTNEWFGVECKWVEGINAQTSKTTRLVWQSITYAQSIFEVNGSNVKPRFVAVFTPDNLPPSIERHLNTLLGLGLYGCVGKLYFYKDGSWGIKFASIYGRSSPDGYCISQKQLPKLRAGSV